MATVLITGGTGLVGRKLTEKLLANGYEVIIMSREAKVSQIPNVAYAIWNVEQQTIDVDAIGKADYIIHLAGAGVADERWSKKRKQEIVDSRTNSCRLIVKTLKENSNKVQAVLCASAIGWYGADPSLHKNGFEENDQSSTDFLGETCKAWEESIDPISHLGKRLVKLRTGIVLSSDGGALKEFMMPLKVGIASILGGGKQIISWIHIDDLCQMYILAIENNTMEGAYNAVAPTPVSNKHLTLTLAKLQRGNFFVAVHVPVFSLKIMLGEMSVEVLKSTTVSSYKIEKAGYHFLYPTVETALKQILLK